MIDFKVRYLVDKQSTLKIRIMTQKETTANNKLIAEFLGFVNTTPEDKDFDIMEHPVTGKLAEPMSMKYHKSWNELMFVVEKIESLGCYVTIDGTDCEITYGGVYYENTNSMQEYKFSTFQDSETKIQAVYNAVLQFIKWWDEQKTKKT